MNKKNTCFIYTDLFLDDLCAVELLARYYDNAVVFVTKENEVAGSPYAADEVQSKDDFIRLCREEFFRGTVTDHALTDGSLPADCDLYLLAPLTDFAKIIKNRPELTQYPALMMGGIEPGPDGAQNEWNASADEGAYRFVVTGMKNLHQVTRNECLRMFAENGYPFDARFLPEYIEKMKKIGENVTCFDLQAVAAAFG